MQKKYLPELAALISAGPIIVYTCDVSDGFATTSITPNVFDQWGYTPEEFMDEPGLWASNIHPEDVSAVITSFDILIEEGVYSREYRFRHKDGTYGWVRDDLRLIVDADGQPEAIVGYATDITSYKKADEDRQRSEAQFRDFTESASDWSWEQDAEFRFTKVSAFKDHRFYNHEKDVIGKTRWGFLGVNPEEDERWGRHVNDLLEHRSFRGFKYNMADVDGVEHIFSINGKPIFDDNGTFTGYRGTVADVSELTAAKNASERFLLALDNFSEGMTLWDAEGRLVICNQVIREMAGAAGDYLQPGITYRNWLLALAQHGMAPEAAGDTAKWLAERMACFEHPVGDVEILREGRWYMFRLQRLPDGSTMQSVFDIHDVKQNEQRFKDFSKIASDWFWESDTEHRISFLSGSIFGQTSLDANSYFGKMRIEFIGEDNVARAPEKWKSHQEDLDAHRPFSDFT